MAMDECSKPPEAVQEGANPLGLSTNHRSRADNPIEAESSLPHSQKETIYVISGGLETCSASHSTTPENTRSTGSSSTKIKQESSQTNEISFTADEQERVLLPHHDALVVTLPVANCLVKRILVDSGSSSNIYWGKISRYDFPQPPGRTQIPRSLVNEYPGSPSEGTLSSVPGPCFLPRNGKLSIRRNLPYFRIWKSLT